MKKIYKKIIPFLIFIIIFLIGIGYSAFSQNLVINSINLDVRIEKDIRITDIMVANSSRDVVSLEDYNISNISGMLTLPYNDSYVLYKIKVTNIGNTSMALISLDGLPNNLEYYLEGYSLGEMLCENSRCSLGVNKEFYLGIRYKNGGYVDDDINYNYIINFNFERVYSVNITGIDITYDKSVVSGEDYVVDFSDRDDIDSFTVYESGNIINDYEYENGILTIRNVTGDIRIDVVKVVKKDFAIEDGVTLLISDRISDVNPILVNELINMSFIGENSSDSVIKRMDVIINYKSNTGSNQSINCYLEYGDVSQKQLVSFKGNTTSSVTVTFSNLNIGINDVFVIRNEINKLTNSNIDITKKSIQIYFT